MLLIKKENQDIYLFCPFENDLISKCLALWLVAIDCLTSFSKKPKYNPNVEELHPNAQAK